MPCSSRRCKTTTSRTRGPRERRDCFTQCQMVRIISCSIVVNELTDYVCVLVIAVNVKTACVVFVIVIVCVVFLSSSATADREGEASGL